MKRALVITIIAMLVFVAMPTSVFAASPEWEAFKTAITKTEGTVILTGDLVGEAEAVTVTGDITLDLAGKTLNLNEQLIVEGKLTIGGSGKVFSDTLGDMIVVRPGATLIVNDAIVEDTAYYAGAIQVFGETGKKTEVTINKDAEVTANYPVYISKPGGQGITINVYGKLNGIYTEKADKSESNGGIGLYVNGQVEDTSANAPVINVYEGAEVFGIGKESVAVYAAGYAVWNIEGGYFEGREALSIKSGTFNITGGTFYADGPYVSPVLPEYNGTECSGSAISMTSNQEYPKKIVMNIENADVISENGYAILEVSTDVATGEDTYVSSMKVNDGIYYGGKEAIFAENVDGFVTGGIYNTDVEKYVDTTIDTVKDEETGDYYVGTLNKVNVKEPQNGKVEVSLTEAIVEQFVKVTATANEGYKVGTISVKDAAGNDVEVVNGEFLMPDSEVTVEVTFEKIQATAEGELDDTPATGSMDKILVVSVIAAAIAIVTVAKKKQAIKNII